MLQHVVASHHDLDWTGMESILGPEPDLKNVMVSNVNGFKSGGITSWLEPHQVELGLNCVFGNDL